MRRLFFGIFGASLLIGCAGLEPPAQKSVDLEAFAALMTDTFQTAPDDPDENFRDRRVRIASPALDGVWIYYQLNTGSERKLYRQRVINLRLADDGGAIIQTTYALKNPEQYVDAWDKPDALASITADDFEPAFDASCEQVWRRGDNGAWSGYVDPKTCRIFSNRRQAYIFIEAEARLDDSNYLQTERGFDENGAQLFGSAPDDFLVLFRQ